MPPVWIQGAGSGRLLRTQGTASCRESGFSQMTPINVTLLSLLTGFLYPSEAFAN